MSSATKIEEILNPTHFQSIEVIFNWVKNITTRTEVSNVSECKLIEYGEKNLVIELDRGAASLGHKLMFHITVKIPSSDSLTFEATAKIDAVDVMDNDRNRLSLSLVQYEEKSWKRFLSTYESRQKEILEFFHMVKG